MGTGLRPPERLEANRFTIVVALDEIPLSRFVGLENPAYQHPKVQIIKYQSILRGLLVTPHNMDFDSEYKNFV